MAETQQNALKKLLRLKRVQKSEGAEVHKRVKAAQSNIADAIRKAAKNPKSATSARFRNSFYGAVSNHYELMADELDAWAQDLTEDLAEEWHGRIKHEARALSASVSSPPLVAKALQFNRKRAQRYFEILNPDNSSQLAATFTRQMSPSTISGLRQSLIDTGRQAAIEGLTHREQHKLLQSKWDKLAGDLSGQRFIDARGRKWDNSTYLNMLVRTTSARITRETTLDTITDNGDDLARVHAIGDNCPICRRWDGVIFSVTGNTPKFPAYSDVLAAGMFHPNCDCLTERVIPEIEADEIDAQAAVKTPVDYTDPKAVDAYSNKLPKPPNAYHPAHYEAKREHIKGLQEKLRNTSGKGSRDTRKALKAEIEKQGNELDEMATILQKGGAIPPGLLAPTAANKKIEQLTAAQARKAKPDEPKPIDTPAPAAFVPAKTVEEAEARIEAKGTKAKLAGLNVENANAVLEAIEETKGKRPTQIKVWDNAESDKMAHMAAFGDEGILTINTAHTRRLTEGAYKTAGASTLPHSIYLEPETVAGKIKAMVHHEIGHFKHFGPLDLTGVQMRRLFDADSAPSEYGKINPVEYFAEWYARYKTSGKQGVPAAMLEVFKSAGE